jgi:hypothetical protein
VAPFGVQYLSKDSIYPTGCTRDQERKEAGKAEALGIMKERCVFVAFLKAED